MSSFKLLYVNLTRFEVELHECTSENNKSAFI